MANIASLLKEEIIRLARKELRAESEGLKKASAQYRSDIAALKRKTAQLEKQVLRLEKMLTQTSPVKAEPNETARLRFTIKGFKTLRQRLGITAAETARLLDVSMPTIYGWEAGKATPRPKQLEKIVTLRAMGKKHARTLLAQQT